MGILKKIGSVFSPPATERASGMLPVAGWLQSAPGFSIEQLWRQQPHLRTVTTFIARMVATVSLHTYERAADGGRERVRDSAVATLFARPNEGATAYKFLYDSVLDFLLYDQLIWLLTEDPSRPDRYRLWRIPPTRVIRDVWADDVTLKKLVVQGTRGPVEYPGEAVIWHHGYSPLSPRRGDSPVNALRETLREQVEAAKYRAQLWEKGPRLGGVITRPTGVKWDDVARRRFKQAWQATYAGSGSGAGGVPVLEDGMKFERFHLSAHDEEVPEMMKLSLTTVAQVFHINPTMVGLLDNANYSNVREFRQSLYGDSLGPIMKQIEELINFVVLPKIAENDPTVDPAKMYVEFNVEERLRGRFEEQAEVTSKAVGAPWMTRNEARAMNNLPAIEGGDDLIMPLNSVAVGEQPEAEDEGGDEA